MRCMGVKNRLNLKWDIVGEDGGKIKISLQRGKMKQKRCTDQGESSAQKDRSDTHRSKIPGKKG